jgi:hypothetical protein
MRALRGACVAVAIGLVIAAAATAEIAQRGKLRVNFEGRITPHVLPRHGMAPIAVTVGGRIATTDRSDPPQLRRIEIAINRNGRLDPTGLPICRYEEIQPSTTENAMRACGGAKVGEGSFSANVVIPEQSPFPSKGDVVVFNGREHGRPVMFAHVYGTDPVPTSYTLPLRISETRGTFGTVLSAGLPKVTSKAAFVTGLSLTIERRFSYRGKRHSYLSADCPAPKGFPGASFSLARATFGFASGRNLAATLTRACGASG